MYNVGVAYLLWFLSCFGALGFHRFYLRKIPTGLLWMFTGGLGMVGSIYDFFTLSRQVDEANYKLVEYKKMQNFLASKSAQRPSIESIILRLAKFNNGTVTPSLLAMEANITVDKAKEALEKLVSKNIAEIRVTHSG